MVSDRCLVAALICACSASVVLGFVPSAGMGCAGAVRSRQGIEAGSTSIIPANAHQHRSFAGAPVIQGRAAAGTRRVGRSGRSGRRRRYSIMLNSRRGVDLRSREEMGVLSSGVHHVSHIIHRRYTGALRFVPWRYILLLRRPPFYRYTRIYLTYYCCRTLLFLRAAHEDWGSEVPLRYIYIYIPVYIYCCTLLHFYWGYLIQQYSFFSSIYSSSTST